MPIKSLKADFREQLVRHLETVQGCYLCRASLGERHPHVLPSPLADSTGIKPKHLYCDFIGKLPCSYENTSDQYFQLRGTVGVQEEPPCECGALC